MRKSLFSLNYFFSMTDYYLVQKNGRIYCDGKLILQIYIQFAPFIMYVHGIKRTFGSYVVILLVPAKILFTFNSISGYNVQCVHLFSSKIHHLGFITNIIKLLEGLKLFYFLYIRNDFIMFLYNLLLIIDYSFFGCFFWQHYNWSLL